jgi:hypothetical protein
MSDLEWYLDVGGKQSGPHTAKEIVELVRSGKISATSQVTAARMNGDWVAAQDLVDAYSELYTKPPVATPISPSTGAAFTATISNPSSSDPNFTAPPRPAEQLEKSKIITLNRADLEKMPDPTEALFLAIQAAREKANNPKSSAVGAATPASRDTFGQLGRSPGPRIPPQLILILGLAAIFGLAVYGVMKLGGSKKAEEAVKTPVAKKSGLTETAPVARTAPAPGGLLNEQGVGNSAARTTPPVQPHAMPGRVTNRPRTGFPGPDSGGMKGGGARYREDNEVPFPDQDEVDESDSQPNREVPEPLPVDPSQVPSDRIIPEPGTIPGQAPRPGSNPYVPPPPAGPPQ